MFAKSISFSEGSECIKEFQTMVYKTEHDNAHHRKSRNCNFLHIWDNFQCNMQVLKGGTVVSLEGISEIKWLHDLAK